MSTNPPSTLKWGILSTGRIAELFCRDLLIDPHTRDVHDVRHEIVAVSSSNSVERASSFIAKLDGVSAKPYGSYADLVADANVDIIYVATPHSHHFQNAMLALEAGKNVLCEKALTVTASQAKKLVETAKSKNLFFMEAVWTRFFPASTEIRNLIASGEIGTVHRTSADLSFNFNSKEGNAGLSIPDSHRMVNADLAGGALLDLGIYSLTWIFQTLYHTQSPQAKEEPVVMAAMNQFKSGVDENTSIICRFPKQRAMGIATTSLLVGTSPHPSVSIPAVRIQGSRGEIQIPHPIERPQSFTVIKTAGEPAVEVYQRPVPQGRGMFWEADECARCIRDGKEQSDVMPWSESIVIMETMEKALADGGVHYPDTITSDVYDASGPLNSGGDYIPTKRL